jgi:hypothetical protein
MGWFVAGWMWVRNEPFVLVVFGGRHGKRFPGFVRRLFNMKTRVIALSALAGLASVASAQTPSFQYSIQGAPAVMAPGATASITILCGFTPGVGGIVNTPIGPRPVLGLSSGSFNIVGTVNGSAFSSLALFAPYNFIGTTTGAAAGSSVAGAIWGNGFGPPLGTVSTVNPTPLWSGTFTQGNTATTLQLNPVGAHGVWAGNPGEFAVESLSTATQGANVIIDVPAPASLALLGLGGLVAARRRR